MAKISDLPMMTLDELRPLVQRALELEEWPEHDWLVAGRIIEETNVEMVRLAMPPHRYNVHITSKEFLSNGIGWGGDEAPLVAIFRAFIAYRASQIWKQKPR